MTAEFERLALIYSGETRAPNFRVEALETAIPRGAEQWTPTRRLPFTARWIWFPFPFMRPRGVLSVGAVCQTDPRSVVQLVAGLRDSIELIADSNVFVTLYNDDGYRVDMQYVKKGQQLRRPSGCGSAYILNVAIGARESQGGIALTSSGAEI